MRRIALASLAVTLLASGAACSSVGSSTVRTGPLRLSPHVGAVAVYLAQRPPAGAAEVGLVEVHASQSEATVETLLPLFVQKAAALGGDAAVVDEVATYFDYVVRSHPETYTYPCGFRATCVGTRMVPMSEEVMTMSIRGRAMRAGAPEGAR